MNNENASTLWKIIQEAGDYFEEQKFSLTETNLHYYTILMEITKVSLK